MIKSFLLATGLDPELHDRDMFDLMVSPAALPAIRLVKGVLSIGFPYCKHIQCLLNLMPTSLYRQVPSLCDQDAEVWEPSTSRGLIVYQCPAVWSVFYCC